jgi:hypothetical protein
MTQSYGEEGNRILELITKIRKDPERNSVDYQERMKQQVPWFWEKYSTLAKMACENETFDMDILHKLLHNMHMVSTNKLSQHDASVVVGERLADIYVKPLL